MPAFALTAAEIAAAEAAAIAAAEAAAIQAAQVAAAEAAAQAAATAAAEQAAAQAATQAATQQATTSGIQTLAQEVAASPTTGIDQLTQAFQNAQVNNVPMSQAEFLNQSFAGEATSIPLGSTPPLPTPSAIPPVPSTPPVASQLPPFSPEKYLIDTMPGSVAPTPPAPPAAPPAAPLYGSGTPSVSSGMGPNTFPNIVPQAPAPAPVVETPSLGGAGTGYRGSAVQIGSGSDAMPYTASELQIMQGQAPQQPGAPETGGLQGLYKDFMNMPLKDKLLTGMMGATGYEMLNKPKPYEKEKYKSTFKPGLYTGYTPVQPTPYRPNYAAGGIADLGGYSDGGRMLKGPGDGMSDDIPATIANKQPARLANEEFVIPADVVSHLGNGSSEAGAKQLYKMMERVRKARTGNKKQGKQINPEKYLA